MLSDLSYQQYAVAERARRFHAEALVRRGRRAAARPPGARGWGRGDREGAAASGPLVVGVTR